MGPGVSQTSAGTFILPQPSNAREQLGLFELAGDLAPGGQAEAYQVTWDGTGYVADYASGTATVYDVLGCYRGVTGDWGFAWQGPDSPNNQIVVLQMKKQTVVTDYRVDSNKLQKKTRDLWGIWDNDESAWTDVHTGTTCP
jgi:hypothetical protein